VNSLPQKCQRRVADALPSRWVWTGRGVGELRIVEAPLCASLYSLGSRPCVQWLVFPSAFLAAAVRTSCGCPISPPRLSLQSRSPVEAMSEEARTVLRESGVERKLGAAEWCVSS
jgi:hypothetical protein